MANTILVDYNNILPVERQKGLIYLVEKIISTVRIGELTNKNITIRLYGGWYENNNITKLAQNLAAEISQDFPLACMLSDKVSPIVASVEIAYSLLSMPGKHLFHTFRTKKLPYDLKSYDPTHVNGCHISQCPIAGIHSFIAKNICGMCNTIRPKDVLFKNEQKLVDTMLTSDLIYSAKTNESTCIVSSDDDFWPGILTSLSYGAKIIHIYTRTGGGNALYLNNISTSNYIQKKL
jgi:hypothetical protein